MSGVPHVETVGLASIALAATLQVSCGREPDWIESWQHECAIATDCPSPLECMPLSGAAPDAYFCEIPCSSDDDECPQDLCNGTYCYDDPSDGLDVPARCECFSEAR